MVVLAITMCTRKPGAQHAVQPPIILTSPAYAPKIAATIRPAISFTAQEIHDSIFVVIHDTLVIDSAKVVEDWLMLRVYNDTLLNTDKGIVIVNDSVTHNRIKSRTHYISIYPQKPPKLRSRVLIGGGTEGWSDKFGLTINLGFQSKHGFLFTVGYDPILKVASLRSYWVISFRKGR